MSLRFVHFGGEVWQLPQVEYRFTLPLGVRLLRIAGRLSIAPVPGGNPASGLVRQTLLWGFPTKVPVGPPPGVNWIIRPDGVKVGGHGELDQHLLCENAKCPDGTSAHVEIDRNYGPDGIEIPDGLFSVFVANQTGRADAGRTRWENDLRPMSTPDTEFHLWFWW